MFRIALVYGTLLTLLGLGGYFGSGRASVTALIPAFFGIPVILCGVLAMREEARKHAMHVAAALGFLSLLASGVRLTMALAKGGGRPLAVGSLATMAILSLVFLALCVRSFVVARLRRKTDAS